MHENQDDIEDIKVIQSDELMNEITFSRRINTKDKHDVNVKDIKEVFIITKQQKTLEVKKEMKKLDILPLGKQKNTHGMYFNFLKKIA